MCRKLVLFSTLALGCGLAAQNTAVFPSDHATIAEGAYSTNWFPYSYGVSRMMAIYEAWDLPVPSGRQITRIGFRQDATMLSYGESLQLEVLMGQTEKTAADAETTFANNYFAPPTTVFGPALHALPDLGNTLNPNPDGRMVWLQLTTPYTFDPSKNLLVEFRVFANTNGGASFTYRLDRAAFDSPIVTGPVGCQHSGAQIPELESTPTKVGRTWYCTLNHAPANQAAFWLVKVGGPLVPQYPLNAFLPGISATCQGQVAMVNLVSVLGTANNNGYHRFSVPIPNDRVFNNLRLSSQAVCLDFFSPGGTVVSNGDQIQLGIAPAMTVIQDQGSATGATGSASRNYGVVTFFEHN